MNWVTIIWAMIASPYLKLGLVHVLVWCRRPEARGNLLFSLSAVETAVFAGCELWMMRGKIISLRRICFLGEKVGVAQGIPGTWIVEESRL